MRLVCLLLVSIAAPLAAHEFWVEPRNYQPPVAKPVVAGLMNGEDFDGSTQPYLPKRFVKFVVAFDGHISAVDGRVGDMPPMTLSPKGDGLHVVAYQATPLTLGYNAWERFQKFVDRKDLGKDLGDVRALHRARGLPESGFDEVFVRFAKSLVGVGNGAGEDLRSGLDFEFVALTNPYTDNLSGGMRLQLFYGDAVRGDAQVELFEKSPDGKVTIRTFRTDEAGIVTVPVRAGHEYLADAVVLREPDAQRVRDTGAVWETLWASMTWATRSD